MSRDFLGAMASMTGLSRDDMRQIWDDVKANQYRLRGCDWHDFEPLSDDDPLRRKYRCRRCGGVVDHHAYYWHEQGRRPRPS